MKRLRLRKDGKVDRKCLNGGHTTPGAGGRPPGSKNKLPISLRGEIVQLHKNSGGIMPLDFMLSVLRLNEVKLGAGRGKTKLHTITFEDKKWAAERLLHCFTPKLTASTVQVKAPVLTLPPEALKGLSEEELLVMEKVFGNMAKDITPMNGTTINGTVNGNGHDNDAILAAEYVQELNKDKRK